MTDLAVTRAEYAPMSLALPSDLSYEEWERIGTTLGQVHRATGFWVGDWVSHGERAYGERYTQALHLTGLDDQTLLNLAWVARSVPTSRRREVLTWSHHAEVASLEPEAQAYWLDRAVAGSWTVRELRRELRPRSEEVRQLHGALNGLREQHGSEVLTPELLTRAVERELQTQEATLLAAASAPREPARDRAVALIGLDAVRTLEDAQLTVIWRGSP